MKEALTLVFQIMHCTSLICWEISLEDSKIKLKNFFPIRKKINSVTQNEASKCFPTVSRWNYCNFIHFDSLCIENEPIFQHYELTPIRKVTIN